MSRLTEKNAILFQGRMCGKTFFTNIYTKLGHIEDLEEQLGVPLDVVFNLFDKIIYLDKTYPCRVLDIRKDNDMIVIHYYDEYRKYDDIVPLKDYQKTWWLKGEKE